VGQTIVFGRLSDRGDRLKVLAPALFVLLSAGCQNAPVHPAFHYPADLGVAVEKADRACLYIANGGLSAGQRVQFVTTSTPQDAGEMEILGKADDTCKEANQDRRGVVRYSFKVIRGALSSGTPAFAIANFSRLLTPTEGGVAADLDGDGHPEFFRACTSTEGLHLTVWKGKPLEGWRKWHYYYYLGYDVTPDCTESDTKPDMER
jgi:hypothetical protein